MSRDRLADDARALGFDEIPSCAGTFSGPIAVVGSARCVWDDLDKLNGFDGHRMAVKSMGLYLRGGYQHWAGFHGERFQWLVPLAGYRIDGDLNARPRRWIPTRRAMTHAEEPNPEVQQVWKLAGQRSGTSGLFGAKVSVLLGYEPVILCGIPMDGTGRFYDRPGFVGNAIDGIEEWERCAPIFAGRVKSMSGRTRDLLGAP